MPVLTKTTPSDAFGLLHLPRELRDMIYEYALTEEGGLIVQKTPLFGLQVRSKLQGSDPNQLKFVCRQLFAETVGLGLTYNDLSFGGSREVDRDGFELFDEFAEKHCSPAHFARVKRVIVFQHLENVKHPNYRQLSFRQLSCRQRSSLETAHSYGEAYPTLKFEVRCCWLHEGQDDTWWYCMAQDIQLTLRGRSPDLTSEYVFKDWFAAESKNVRLYPLSVKPSWLVANDTPLERAWAPQYKKWLEEGF